MSTTNTIGHQISYNRNQQSVSITYNDAKGNKTVVTIFANSDGNKTFDVGDKIVVKATDAKGMACTPQVDAGLIDNLLGYINGKTIDAVTELKDLQTSGNLFDPSRIDNNGVIEEITTFGALSKAATQDVAYPPNSDMPYYSYPNSDDLCSLVMGSIPKYYSSDSDVMPFNAPNIDSPTLNQTSSRPVAYYQGLQPYSYSPDYTYGTKDLYYLVSDYMSNDWTQANADYGQNIDNILSLGTNIETVIPTEDTPSTNDKQSASTQNANGTPAFGTNTETVIPTEDTPSTNDKQSASTQNANGTPLVPHHQAQTLKQLFQQRARQVQIMASQRAPQVLRIQIKLQLVQLRLKIILQLKIVKMPMRNLVLAQTKKNILMNFFHQKMSLTRKRNGLEVLYVKQLT